MILEGEGGTSQLQWADSVVENAAHRGLGPQKIKWIQDNLMEMYTKWSNDLHCELLIFEFGETDYTVLLMLTNFHLYNFSLGKVWIF